MTTKKVNLSEVNRLAFADTGIPTYEKLEQIYKDRILDSNERKRFINYLIGVYTKKTEESKDFLSKLRN